jgi:hypothetical protein
MAIEIRIAFKHLLVFLVLFVVRSSCSGLDVHQGSGLHFFGLTNLWTAELRFNADEWKQLQLGKRASFSDSQPSETGDDSRRNYTYAHADLQIGNALFTNVGVRLKGGGSQSGNSQERWPFRIDFQKYVANRQLDGVSKISFNNNVFDSSYLRETLSYDCFRSFKIPAPRTCFVKMYLSVSETYSNKYLGLYNAAEAIEADFLKSCFDNPSGLLSKPDFGFGRFPSGSSWLESVSKLHPKTLADEPARQRMVAFFKLLNDGDEKMFRNQIESFIDLDEYLRFLVVNVVLVNQDSYLGMGKNYYTYLDPGSNKLFWIPWDLDLSFGGFFLCGKPNERMELSIDHPSTIRDPLIRRVLAVPEFGARYHALMREFLAKQFNKAALFARVDLLRGIIRDAVREEKRNSTLDFEQSLDGRSKAELGSHERNRWMIIEPGLKLFIEKRTESIQAQLNGKSQGLRTGFGDIEPW